VLDQFSRPEIWHVTSELRRQTSLGYFLDYGCGSAVITWTALPDCAEAVLVDVPNLNQEFVRWRLDHYDSHQAAVLTPDEAAVFPAGMFDTIFCIDVLEHLPEPTPIFERFDQWLKPGGILLHRSPWAKPDEQLCEHLAEATADWFRPGGGASQLAQRYNTLTELPFGGVYMKR
jgi:2-polyprenyl-3-methyl-5-hydroxy-6-metoxy-1,4-benzoquinol methylase